MLRILFFGFILWLLCGVASERVAVAPTICGAELLAADGLGDQFRCERLYNSDFNLSRGICEVVSQIPFRSVVRTEASDANLMLKCGAVEGFNRGTAYASRSCGLEAPFICGSAVDYYIYRLGRLII